MFEIPEQKLPDFAKDEQKITVLFAPLRNRTVNPKDWEHKINSWKTLISIYCACNEIYSFCLSSLNKVFLRNGRPPLCLKEVLDQMLREGSIQQIDRFLVKNSTTWSGWATDMLLKKPLAWSFGKLKNTIYVTTDDCTYVDLELIKTKSNDLMNKIPKDHLNKVISLPELLKFINENSNYTQKLKLLLHYLEKDGKVCLEVSSSNDCDYKIKFGDGISVKPIDEVDIGIHSLEKNETTLLENIEKLEDEMEKLRGQAKLQLSKGHRQTAKTCLRKKHEIEKKIQKKSDALHNIQIMLEKIKDTHTDAHVWESYKLALNSFNTTFKDSNLSEDAIEDTMIKLGEVLDIHEDIQTALSHPVKDTSTSESDLEQELADLISQEDSLTEDSEEQPAPDDFEARLKNLSINLPDVPETKKPKLEVPLI
ncbi:unnamed protein product [Brassicogethes aeneus]|uniref:Charged multivesicular body protein 7 n=1 Tax=Brassicogethes aeneus TaxID=1431903 RepID=A0A9P0FJE2_BRAAE|nr:unnamed protein product [Brassicogethes aeneus]